MASITELIQGIRRMMFSTAQGDVPPAVLVDQNGNVLTVTSEFDAITALKATADQIGAIISAIVSPSATPTVVKATAGQVYGAVYVNMGGQATTFCHIFLNNAAPTVGTTVPDLFAQSTANNQQIAVTVPAAGVQAPSGIRVALTNGVLSAVSAPAGSYVYIAWR
jgi:hypothetical protein